VPGLRSLRNRLAVIFALIIIGAIGTIYLSVTPRLEASLTSQRENQVAADGRRLTPLVHQFMPKSGRRENQKTKDRRDRNVRKFAESQNTELIVMSIKDAGPFLLTDSTPDGGATSRDVQAVTRRAWASKRQATDIVNTRTGRVALSAQIVPDPEKLLDGNYVAIFSDSLSDVVDNVALIRRQVLISGGIALVIAILAGYLVARALAARVKRLERAARKVAAGDFSQPIRADSDDELGQLAAAFDDMQAQLARLDRARKQFIANASHELRTPIFSLGGFLELLADEDLDEETRRAFLEQIRGQVDRMHRLAVELLDLSRLESGVVPLERTEFRVEPLLEHAVREQQLHAPEIAVSVSVDSPDLTADGDPERVHQVVANLLENAVRHTPQGGSVEVRARRFDAGVTIEVLDEGPGIAEVDEARVFERFYRADSARASTDGGAGLGLAIAQWIVDLHGGDIHPERRDPQGCRMVVTLPQHPVPIS